MTGTMTTMGVLNDFVAQGQMFSAFDVTKKLRKEGQDVRHYNVKAEVHAAFFQGAFGPDYNRQLVTLDLGYDDVDAFVYYPSSASPYDYPLAKKQTVQVGDPTNDGTVSVDGDDDDAESDVVATTKVVAEHRVQIPQKVLRKIDMSKSTFASFDIICNGKWNYSRFPESDGRVRITAADIPVGTKLNLKVKNSTIHISPA